MAMAGTSYGLKDVPEVKAVASANTQFSIELFHALKEEFPQNLIYSPFSVSCVVALAQVGARGETSKEIAKAFGYPVDGSVLGKGYEQVLASLQGSNEGYTLSTANKIYPKIGFKIKGDYAKEIRDRFLAEVEQLDFGDSAAAAATINGWVEKTTHGKIKDLVQPDSLGPGTELVLVNGVYFKGLWKDQFKPEKTEKAPFFLNETEEVEADIMCQTKKFPYAEFNEMDAHAIALPYKGDRLAMLIIAPKSKTGLGKVEQGLKNFNPENILSKLFQGDKIAVRLPKFKLECTIPLVSPLKKMGLSTMFSSQADFSGIPEDPTQGGLFVSEVIQKAFIEVNEEGSEAAAATSIMMKRCIEMTTAFDADRPFIFQIIDQATNFVLFSGRCSNPLEN